MTNAFEDSPIERRNKPRILCDYPALIKGQDAEGKKFRESGRLCNMSAKGLYLLSKRDIQLGEEIKINITMTSGSEEMARQLYTRCVVLRTEALSNETYGVALKILQYRFL